MSVVESSTFALQVILNRSLPGSNVLPLSDAALMIFDIQRIITILYGFILSNVMSRRLFGA